MRAATDKLRLSEISPHIVQSEIRSMTVECDRLGGVNLAQGVCDTEVPEPVSESAIEAIRDGYNIYTRLDGVAPLREAIARKLARHNGLNVDPNSEVLVTSGATGAFYAAALALLNPGDEVILFEPFYGYHLNTLLALRIKPVVVPLAYGDWALDLDRLRAAVTPRTRALLINTPSSVPNSNCCSFPEKAIAFTTMSRPVTRAQLSPASSDRHSPSVVPAYQTAAFAGS